MNPAARRGRGAPLRCPIRYDWSEWIMTREFKPPSSRSLTWRLTRWVLMASLVLLGTGAGEARGADASFTLDFGNAYIWRGIVFNDDGVMQFGLDASPLNVGSVPIGFNVWGNYDLGDYGGTIEVTEISELDLVVYATLPQGFEVGYIEYQFPQIEAGDTREFYVTWSKEMVVTPTVSVYFDFGIVDSVYSTLDLTYSFPLQGKFSLSASGLMAVAGKGWGEAAGGTKGGFYNYSLYATAGYQVNEVFGLQLVGGYSGSLDTDVLPKQPLGGYILGGVNFSF
jgi:hypothetical protein